MSVANLTSSKGPLYSIWLTGTGVVDLGQANKHHKTKEKALKLDVSKTIGILHTAKANEGAGIMDEPSLGLPKLGILTVGLASILEFQSQDLEKRMNLYLLEYITKKKSSTVDIDLKGKPDKKKSTLLRLPLMGKSPPHKRLKYDAQDENDEIMRVLRDQAEKLIPNAHTILDADLPPQPPMPGTQFHDSEDLDFQAVAAKLMRTIRNMDAEAMEQESTNDQNDSSKKKKKFEVIAGEITPQAQIVNDPPNKKQKKNDDTIVDTVIGAQDENGSRIRKKAELIIDEHIQLSNIPLKYTLRTWKDIFDKNREALILARRATIKRKDGSGWKGVDLIMESRRPVGIHMDKMLKCFNQNYFDGPFYNFGETSEPFNLEEVLQKEKQQQEQPQLVQEPEPNQEQEKDRDDSIELQRQRLAIPVNVSSILQPNSSAEHSKEDISDLRSTSHVVLISAQDIAPTATEWSCNNFVLYEQSMNPCSMLFDAGNLRQWKENEEANKNYKTFGELVPPGKKRRSAVLIFTKLLEMQKNGEVRLEQSECYGTIKIINVKKHEESFD